MQLKLVAWQSKVRSNENNELFNLSKVCCNESKVRRS